MLSMTSGLASTAALALTKLAAFGWLDIRPPKTYTHPGRRAKRIKR